MNTTSLRESEWGAYLEQRTRRGMYTHRGERTLPSPKQAMKSAWDAVKPLQTMAVLRAGYRWFDSGQSRVAQRNESAATNSQLQEL